MTTLNELHQTVQNTLASKRLGKPRFVRYHLQGVLKAEGAAILPALANVAAVIGDWMGQPPGRLYSLFSGKDGRGQTTLTVQFPDGASALLSEVHGQPNESGGIHLMVIGNKGALTHQFDEANIYHWDRIPASLPRRDVTHILAAIENTREKGTNPIAIPKPRENPPPKPPEPERDERKPKYGILLVTGSHTHQENYAAAFAADPRCKLIAVTDERDVDQRRRKLNERLARELGVPHEPDLVKALARKEVDIVSICAEPERRGRIAVLCAQAGKHLYLDKSLAPKLAEADALLDAVRKNKIHTHMFSFISQPWAEEARRILASDYLGTLLAIHTDTFFAKGRPGTAKLGTPRKEEYPPERHQLLEAKRELDNVGVYPITLVQWLTGKKFQTVYGVTGNYFFAEHQKHNVEDFGLLACTLENGLPVTIAGGRYGWTTHPAGGVNRLLLVGSKNTVLIDANRPRLEVYTDEPPWTPPNVNPEDPMGFWSSTQAAVHLRPKQSWVPVGGKAKSDVAYFLDCLDAGKESEMSVVEAAMSTEVLLAGYHSAAKGEVVKLPLPRK